MSWQEDLENIVFTIITGDGVEYTPKWKNATKEVEYNTAIFEFVEVEGSLALRKKMKGRKFDLEFYFDGENAVTTGNNFEISARSNKYWTVQHPFYGNITCQPLSLRQDNSSYNVSKFNVQIIETITTPYPELTKIVKDDIIAQVEVVNEAQAQAFEASKELDKVELQENITALDTVYSKIITTSEELKEFKYLVNNAVNEITNVTSTGLSILREVQALINYPATVIQTIEGRFNAVKEAFQGILDTFTGNKNQFEAVAGSIVNSMFLTSVSEPDYQTRSEVINQQQELITEYNRYLSALDNLQTDRADSDDSYLPSFESINALATISNLTVANLFDVSFGLKQEREYTLEQDSNAILLTHRFYGLDNEDENLNTMINTNNLSLNEFFNIKKGRTIVYYV